MSKLLPGFAILFAVTILAVPPAAATPFGFSYGGRLADEQDHGVAGPVALELRFWSAAVNGTDLLGRPLKFAGVTLDDGVFQVDAGVDQFAAKDMQAVFGATGDTWVEIKDATHGVTYPRQRLSAVPYALKVPVDGKTLTYDASGNLTFVAGTPAAGQVLTTDASGKLNWAAPTAAAAGVTSIIAGTGLNITGTAAVAITSSGILNVNVGSGAGQIPQLVAANQLPALDGSLLSNVTAVSAGTVGGASAASIAAAANLASTATPSSTATTLVKRDASGGFAAGSVNVAAIAMHGNLGNIATDSGGTLLTFDYSGANNITATTGFLDLGAGGHNGIFEIRSTNSAPSLIVDNNNVGIGETTSPSSRLEVKGPDSSSSTYAVNVINGASSPLLSVRDDGNVGIGSANPAFKLVVMGNSQFNGSVMTASLTTVGPISASGGLQVGGAVMLPTSMLNTGACPTLAIPANTSVAIFANSSGSGTIALPACSPSNDRQVLTLTNASSSCALTLAVGGLASGSSASFPAVGNSRTLICDGSLTGKWY